MMLVQYLCLLTLEANRSVVRLLAVELSPAVDIFYHGFFFCSVFIISEVTATIITPPVMLVIQCFVSHYNAYHGPHCDGPTETSHQHDMDLPSPLMLGDTRSVVGITTVLQQ